MRHQDDIVIRLRPYTVYRVPFSTDEGTLVVEGQKFVTGDEATWCSLPDILYDDSTKVFSGLSFPVNLGQERYARALVESIGSPKASYVGVHGASDADRYVGFGECDRVELYWMLPRSEIRCEFASLFQGCWLHPLPEASSKDFSAPYGYWLSTVHWIAEEHSLVIPQNIA